MNEIILGDCLEVSKQIEAGSVDLILTDPPYGTVGGIGAAENINHGMRGKTNWDLIIKPTDIYITANRILRKNGKLVLFAQEPYTNQLISEAIPNLPYCYRMVWEKDHFANSLIAKKAPVSFYEDILVFTNIYDNANTHPLRGYFESVCSFIGLKPTEINKRTKTNTGHFFRFTSKHFLLLPEKNYNELIDMFGIDKMEGFKVYGQLKEIDQKYDNTFNLWEGKKYKSNILKYKKDYGGLHPTQKPVLLLEDLIKTYSNEGDLVVDLTVGSGSTAVACINTGRNFIGIEKDPEYCEIARARIKQPQAKLFQTFEEVIA